MCVCVCVFFGAKLTSLFLIKILSLLQSCYFLTFAFPFSSPHCRRVLDYMDDTVTHVVTQQSWDTNFDQVWVCVCGVCMCGVCVSVCECVYLSACL